MDTEWEVLVPLGPLRKQAYGGRGAHGARGALHVCSPRPVFSSETVGDVRISGKLY